MTRQVTLICGPPCVGKTTYAIEHMERGDLVVDYDLIARSLGSRRSHGHGPKYHRRVEASIARSLAAIEAGRVERAWVIRSLPRRAEREALATRLGAALVLLDEPDDVLRDRAQRRPNPSATLSAIMQWRAASA